MAEDLHAHIFGGIPDAELNELNNYWTAFPSLRSSLFAHHDDTPYSHPVTADVATCIWKNMDVVAFRNHCADAMNGLDSQLEDTLIKQMNTINPDVELTRLTADLFKRTSALPLIDRYAAYQTFSDHWMTIATDVEMIQTEGFAATRQVDPNMVIKKKDGKDQEVQDGWVGHVIPFDLVQQTMLSESVAAIRAIEDRLSEIASGYEEALDALPEEEKDKDFVNDDKTAFVWPAVKKAIKERSVEPAVLEILKKVSADNEEEKRLKKQLKDQSAALHMETKKTIEGLTDEQVYALLEKKWIAPLVDGLFGLPERIISDFVTKLEKLATKYETTFEGVEAQIHDTEAQLSGMIAQLTGSEYDMEGLAELRKMLGGL